MSEQFSWMLQRLYLVWFWPSRYEKERSALRGFLISKERGRIVYLLKLFPMLAALAAAGNVMCGMTIDQMSDQHEWPVMLVGLVIGLAGALMVGAIFMTAGGKLYTFILAIFAGALYLVENDHFRLVVGFVLATSASTIFSGFVETKLAARFGIIEGVALGIGFAAVEGLLAGFVCGGLFLIFYFRVPGFILDTLWGWRCNNKLTVLPSLAPSLWRQYPLAWDQVIWFPLPGACDFLAKLVRHDRDFGLDRISFIAAERPLQARAATAALEEVALTDLTAKTIPDLVGVPRRLKWLTDAPRIVSADMREMVPEFVRVAEYYAQSRSLQSNYRKREAVEASIAELKSLRKKLIGLSSPISPRLLQEANEWNRLLQGELEQLSASAQAEREIPQVFRFGNPVREDESYVFAGRQDLVRQLESILVGDAHPPAILLHGARRMGKTSILFQLPRLLGPRFACCFLDCQLPSVRESAARFFYALSNALVDALEYRAIQSRPLSLDVLNSEPFGVFDDWLQKIERSLPALSRVFICFDEYEALNETLVAGWGTKLLDYIRHLQQHRPKFLLIFTGVKTFHRLGSEWNSRFVGARLSRVSFLTPDEFRPMLEQPVPEFNLHYGPGVLDELLRLTNGQPFLTQAVAKELVDLLNDDRRHEAGLDDLERAAQLAMRSGVEYFHNVWNDAEADGQLALTTVVTTRNSFPATIREHLREMDVIDQEGRFAIPLFQSWVKNRIAKEHGQLENHAGSVLQSNETGPTAVRP